MDSRQRIGVMSAMKEEIELLFAEMNSSRIVRRGMREYHEGELWGVPAVLVFSRWGKVASATTATDLITGFGVNKIVFSGVAGSTDPNLSVGDVVVGTRLVQHDMDSRPMFERHEIPLIGVTEFKSDSGDSSRLAKATRSFLDGHFETAVPENVRREFGIEKPKVVEGLIGSGDQFFSKAESVRELKGRIPGLLAVEMEGAAVAQVCHEYGVPFSIIRTISDSADESAPFDFPNFVARVSCQYSHAIMKEFLR